MKADHNSTLNFKLAMTLQPQRAVAVSKRNSRVPTAGFTARAITNRHLACLTQAAFDISIPNPCMGHGGYMYYGAGVLHG